MKKVSLIITLFILVLTGKTCYAQVTPPAVICGIWYKYDNDGNRIKRYYECISTLPTSKIAGSEDSVATAPEPTIEIDKFTGEVLRPSLFSYYLNQH